MAEGRTGGGGGYVLESSGSPRKHRFNESPKLLDGKGL